MDVHAKLERLEMYCRSLGRLAVAFSGGLDSRFLCHIAARAGVPVRALHISGPHIARSETAEARQWAEECGIPFTLLHADPLHNQAVRANGPDRCYHCKHAAFTMLRAHTEKGEILCDGTNASDLSGYRPGLRALTELGVVSPLAATEAGKDDIRALARKTGMDRPEQQARPCLLTRYEYGLEPDAASLAALDDAERLAAAVFAAGGSGDKSAVPQFRLRLTREGPVFHVQAADLPETVQKRVTAILDGNGFTGARVERVDQISGFFDRQGLDTGRTG